MDDSVGNKTRRAFLYLAAFPLLDAMVNLNLLTRYPFSTMSGSY